MLHLETEAEFRLIEKFNHKLKGNPLFLKIRTDILFQS